MNEITKKNVFGEVVAHVHTIEFQKRGLPHMHALIFLEKSQKICTVEQVDKFVSAELPDEKENPILFDTVRKCMVHGPCGDRDLEWPCMREGKCTKNYPKKYNDATCLDGGGYPVYRRRDNGKEVIVRNRRKAYNTDVVPYNPHLSRMFNCHINVEVCAGIRAVKYINKYIYKGYDKTTVVVGPKDEVQMYIDARYIGPPEAAWRLYGYSMHKEHPHVERLAIHFPGKQKIIYESAGTIDDVAEKAENYKSTLMTYFEYYAENPTTPAYTYHKFPQHFVWLDDHNTLWTIRQQGANSFEQLKIVKGELHHTFKKACIALGVLADDGEWLECLEETGYPNRQPTEESIQDHLI
ncbi:uncharacterized protein LOC113360460 [Papaver somniferum]|uniref:uncharacterized protein LOC113360460 n=1 Tax=Papaver somniferum TaxID=3469 RepID=UPI000E7029FC|nr:uncharacterized protein LOC113360460 [Papaver somniferum]